MRVVVVTGGTQVDWDDMRTLTNKSKGKFGCRIANDYHYAGCKVTLIHAESVDSAWISRGITDLRSFRTYDELYDILIGLASERFDIIVMAAAISDYAFDKVDGKVSSDQEIVTVTLRKTKKILGEMREWYKDFRPFIVGFKLLSGVTTEELRTVSINQIKKCRINMTVANDWRELQSNPGYHPCYFVTPEGGFIRHDDHKVSVSSNLVDFTLKRVNVKWGESLETAYEITDEDMMERLNAGDLLRFAQLNFLDQSSNGNVTFRSGDNFWATPRQINKSNVTEDDLIYVIPDVRNLKTFYVGDTKPSIDCVVHGHLYRKIPELFGIIHFHNGYVIPNAKTKFPYPCGTEQEADEIISSLSGDFDFISPKAIELIDHGYILLLGYNGREILWQDYESCIVGISKHWKEINQGHLLNSAEMAPIVFKGRIAGLVARVNGWSSIYLLPDFQGHQVGTYVTSILAKFNTIVAVHDDCHAIDFYKKINYIELERHGKLTIMGQNGKLS